MLKPIISCFDCGNRAIYTIGFTTKEMFCSLSHKSVEQGDGCTFGYVGDSQVAIKDDHCSLTYPAIDYRY